MCFGGTYLSWVTNTTSRRLLAFSWWIKIGNWQLKLTKSTRDIGSTMWWGILGLVHGHILMNCSFGLIFLQKKSKSWKLLIGPSVIGTMKMLHSPTIFKWIQLGCCGQILCNFFYGIVCPICQNGFGPEGGMALGSCQYIYHLMCLINIFLVRRFCTLCQSHSICMSSLVSFDTCHLAMKKTLKTSLGDYMPFVSLLFTNTYMCFLASLHTCHQVERRSMTTP